jgi:hypothetical protein
MASSFESQINVTSTACYPVPMLKRASPRRVAFGKGAGATAVVVDELEEGGALAVVEVGLV